MHGLHTLELSHRVSIPDALPPVLGNLGKRFTLRCLSCADGRTWCLPGRMLEWVNDLGTLLSLLASPGRTVFKICLHLKFDS